jgi:hypothetical protein
LIPCGSIKENVYATPLTIGDRGKLRGLIVKSVKKHKLLCLLFLVFAGPSWLLAQLDTGSIRGTITDPGGSVVGNVNITATETATGTSYTTASSKTGYYVFPSVRTGVYTITLTAPGFKTEILSGITVSVGTSSSHDFVLQLGQVAETVSVSSAALTLETATSEVGTSIQPAGRRILVISCYVPGL